MLGVECRGGYDGWALRILIVFYRGNSSFAFVMLRLSLEHKHG